MTPYRILFGVVNIFTITFVMVTCQKNDFIKSKDYISSMANKVELLEQNGELILNLFEYIDELQARIDILKRLSKHMHQPQLTAKAREHEFLSNSVSTFSLIRQMHSDWSHLEQIIEQPVGPKQIDFIGKMQMERPQLEHLREAMFAIHRIQANYALNSSDMAKGLLDGEQYDAQLSPLDCYEMGFLFYNGSLYDKATEWLTTARDLIDKSQIDVYPMLGLSRTDISLLLARSFTALGKFELARAVLHDEPQFMSLAEEMLDNFKANIPETVKNEQLIELSEEYARLCSSSFKPKPTRLLCSYKTTPSPFLRLAPFKMEQISVNPDIFTFHDVVYSSEIAVLERVTEPLLKRATIRSWDTHEEIVSNDRILRSAWLPPLTFSRQVNQLVDRIDQRISDFSGTGFKPRELMEPLQILKYGFGEYISMHVDIINISSFSFDDRIATVMLYLNDNVSGGSTIFDKLELAVKPERGKALIWYNVMPDTYDFEPRNQHASCTVKYGYKLAFLQWIHENDQVLTMPCMQPPKHHVHTEN